MAPKNWIPRRRFDLHEEGRAVYRLFQEASAEIPQAEELRPTLYFRFLVGAEEGGNLYTHFPFLFAEQFPEIGRRELRKLSLMALLFLHHILIDDEMCDEKAAPPAAAIHASRGFLLRALGTLDDLLADHPLPWTGILQLHNAHSQAHMREEREHSGQLKPYAPEDLMAILAAKSSMAKLIPLALGVMSGRRAEADAVERSLDYFYLADQMIDDHRDWKEDLRQGHFSYLLTRVIVDFDLRRTVQEGDIDKNREAVGRSFYLTGAAESYFEEICGYVERAKEEVRGMDCPRWITFLNDVELRACALRSQVFYEVRKNRIARDRFHAGSDAKTDFREVSGPRLVEAGDRAAAFLRERFETGAGCSDFLVFDRELPVQVTAYVGCALRRWNAARASTGGSAACHSSSDASIARFLEDCSSPSGWAANEAAPPDCCTTAWAIQFFLSQGNPHDPFLSGALANLNAFRQPDGGFATYIDSIPPTWDSWRRSHPESTALAVATLAGARRGSKDNGLKDGVEFLRRTRRGDGLWPAFWWDSRMFATYHCFAALRACRHPLAGMSGQAASSIAALQGADGSWGDYAGGGPNAFETAFAVRCLLLAEAEDPSPCLRGAGWLLDFQNADGAWESRPILRLPAERQHRPWNDADWRVDASTGLGALVRDQKRCFTTASALAALADLLESEWLRTGRQA